MAWKATGQPTVRKQRDKWVVRVDGIDTATGKHRPRQLGTYTSQRSAQAAARNDAGRRIARPSEGTVSWLGAPLRRVAHRHHREGPRAVRVGDPPHRGRPRRDPAGPARPRRRRPRGSTTSPPAGKLSTRSVQICRTVLRAALAEAVDEGLIARSPAARVGLPRTVAKPVREKEAVVWTCQQVDRFLAVAG